MNATAAGTRRRLIYNYDAWAPFYDCKWTGTESTVAALTSLRKSIDLIAGSQVTTVALCPNVGQSVNFPSAVSALCQWRPLSPEAAATLSKAMGESFAQITRGISALWREQGIGMPMGCWWIRS